MNYLIEKDLRHCEHGIPFDAICEECEAENEFDNAADECSERFEVKDEESMG